MRRILIVLLFFLMIAGLCLAEDGKITIIHEDLSQFELISPEGIKVLLDVADPEKLFYPPTGQDILLTTHTHADHLLPSFEKSFPGQKLTAQTGELSSKGVKAVGIASTHIDTLPIVTEEASNYIMLVEMGGLRIAHFGGIGQKSLTPEQLAVLGEIDIALMQFSNLSSSMYIDNLKGFNLMDQLKPKLIIPTHIDEVTSKYAAQKWDSYFLDEPFKLDKSQLTSKTKIIFLNFWGEYLHTLKLVKRWTSEK